MNDQHPCSRGRFVAPEAWQPLGVDSLEPAARDAVRHEGNSAVVAGPGAGKTEFLAQRAAFLFQTGLCRAPQRVLAISYKRDSATNLARRVSSRLPEYSNRFVSLTFDAFAKGLVDRFGAALPKPWRIGQNGYEISLWTASEIGDWAADAFSNETASLQYQMRSIVDRRRFLHDVVGTYQLPNDPTGTLTDPRLYADMRWWHDQYLTGSTKRVDFVMLNRLAELLVRSNPQVRNAIRATYPFVFVDEFQDTTAAQITFLDTLFGGPGVTTTAVGDGKQRIMQFAGAIKDALAKYESDFEARRFDLSWNFRSSEPLVAAQHVVGTVIDAQLERAESKILTSSEVEPLSIWTYPSASVEAAHLAHAVAKDIRENGRRPSDTVLLVRQKVAVFEPALAAAFSAEGLRIRNDDTVYGKMRLQDLLKHDLNRLLISVLSLACTPPPLPDEWLTAYELVGRVAGADRGRTADRRTADELGRFVRWLRAWLEANAITTTSADAVVRAARNVVDDDRAAAFVFGQNAGDEVEVILEALTARVQAIRSDCKSWSELVARIADEDAVPLMTIHRSKGLEFHTVVLLGLDDDQWWAYAKDPGEATSTFFVALSRAAGRVIFTKTDEHPATRKIRGLYELLDTAGATYRRFDSIDDEA
ncbi:UvrD-helicase domain-containing protein [Curtobacterium flaccumfaciens]|uniref:UvrD-helicase domain-containing protein n=1 Tax=Curtobacterium flaccumfaciens TaxID=2035 RepID=UPI001BDE9BEF|nr:ATP-dependent helicase [Curtobacterium flaccumfaciens]MBT1631648.1 ATP-dependent helicase [Curtobacterium flaccumfaciens pv. oortii]MCX2844160.1 ATP-dependent helicase [Curtobacterium flaccumfaciens pv. oortii]